MTGIFIDLDGTLLNDQGKISKEDLEYLKSIKEKYKIILSTGRTYSKAKEVYDEMGLNTFFSSSNGKIISCPFKNEEYIEPIDEDDIEYILNNNNNIVNWIKVSKNYSEKLKENTDINKFLELDFKTIKNIKEPITDFFLEINTNELKTTKNINEYIWINKNDNNFCIITPVSINKLVSMKKIINLEKITNTIYIGNGDNDIDCIKFSNKGIAMINSKEDIKKHSNMITKFDNNNSGVSRMLISILDNDRQF